MFLLILKVIVLFFLVEFFFVVLGSWLYIVLMKSCELVWDLVCKWFVFEDESLGFFFDNG